MPEKKPHISLPLERLIPRVLGISLQEAEAFPEDVAELAKRLAAELFLVIYNPFIDADDVRSSVNKRLQEASNVTSGDYMKILRQSVAAFWKRYEEDKAFLNSVVERLREYLPEKNILTNPNHRVECATDATDLRMALPMAVLTPDSIDQIQAILRIANEMHFAVIPRGGGSGMTGGAIPGDGRAIVLSLSRLKKIISVDEENMLLCAQAGVLTLNAINAAAEKNLLLTIDPASKAASSLGGNISENAGGPFAFEYGTTLDNIASYKVVRPDGSLAIVSRRDHPRHKILPDETAIFDVRDEKGELLEEIRLPGDEIRGKALGKDVTNKFLGGLPIVQKEGVDGIVCEACFTLYEKLKHSRTLCLEFYGRSMHNAMLVIRDVVGLRDTIRTQGDLVKISALEEFGPKYVTAIDYQKKSGQYEGDPISVLLLQLDSQDEAALEKAVGDIVDIATPYEQVDIFVARDEKESELFWEDRHKLSAISKRTSGFKINEDIVIPLNVVPEFSRFLEELNLYYTAKAYRFALQKVSQLAGIPPSDEFISMEMQFAAGILRGTHSATDLSDTELQVQTSFFFKDLKSRYPKEANAITKIFDEMLATRIEVANHMHAGDGNCHVNIPVNSNDAEMMRQALEAADKVFERVTELGGAISGEHGIGITKIGFLSEDKIRALRAYKAKVDPNNVLNPGKLVKRELSFEPYTFSFNRLILDLTKTALPEKDRLIALLSNIQVCTRCGKCKQVCPMYNPERGLMFHPRNKNISLGALIEAVYYSQLQHGRPDPFLLDKLRALVEHCTGCGKCVAACPVKINTPDATLHMRAFLHEKGAAGHPLKMRVLNFLSDDPAHRVPRAAKVAAWGQALQNRAAGLIPAAWRQRFENPMLQGPGPLIGFKNLSETLHLDKGSFFIPENAPLLNETVFYFPGCGASLFYRSIGMAALNLLLKVGATVIMPDIHLCCGYPLLVSGCEEAYAKNKRRNLENLLELFHRAGTKGLHPKYVLTSCGTCREGLSHYDFKGDAGVDLIHQDVTQYLMTRLDAPTEFSPETILYHASCHSEWSGVVSSKAPEAYRQSLSDLTGDEVRLSPGCCGESGLGAMTSPAIYNKIREKKQEQLEKDFTKVPESCPLIVGCPSCKIGIKRSLIAMKRKNPVLHSLEYLSERADGPDWKKALRKSILPQAQTSEKS